MIFLSTSVPTPGREFFGTENIFAIREAIVSFTKVCVEYGLHFYFGGHPAITPLIWDVAIHNSHQTMPLIEIYQSKIFDDIPKEVKDFKNIHLIDAVGGCREKSVYEMRKRMFEENYTECAVFIGGMDGIIKEYEMLKELYPRAKYYAIASTGGAAKILYERIGEANPLLVGSYAYVSMFRELLYPFKKMMLNE